MAGKGFVVSHPVICRRRVNFSTDDSTKSNYTAKPHLLTSFVVGASTLGDVQMRLGQAEQDYDSGNSTSNAPTPLDNALTGTATYSLTSVIIFPIPRVLRRS